MKEIDPLIVTACKELDFVITESEEGYEIHPHFNPFNFYWYSDQPIDKFFAMIQNHFFTSGMSQGEAEYYN